MSSITRVGFGEGEAGSGGVASALIEQNAAQIEALGAILERSDEKRSAFEDRIADLTDRVSRLASATQEQVANGHDRGAEQQIALLERIAARLEKTGRETDEEFEGDAEVRARIRNIDRQLLRLLEEMATGRQDAVAELRAELATLNRALSRLGDGADASR